MIILHFDLQPQFKYMSYFIYTSNRLTPHGRYELDKLTSLPMCGFIAQLVEHRTGIAEVTGSNPVEALTYQCSVCFHICDLNLEVIEKFQANNYRLPLWKKTAPFAYGNFRKFAPEFLVEW